MFQAILFLSLPNMRALLLCQEEFGAFLDVEGVVPGVDVGQGGVDASLVGRVGVDGDEILHVFGAHVGGPDVKSTL